LAAACFSPGASEPAAVGSQRAGAAPALPEAAIPGQPEDRQLLEPAAPRRVAFSQRLPAAAARLQGTASGSSAASARRALPQDLGSLLHHPPGHPPATSRGSSAASDAADVPGSESDEEAYADELDLQVSTPPTGPRLWAPTGCQGSRSEVLLSFHRASVLRPRSPAMMPSLRVAWRGLAAVSASANALVFCEVVDVGAFHRDVIVPRGSLEGLLVRDARRGEFDLHRDGFALASGAPEMANEQGNVRAAYAEIAHFVASCIGPHARALTFAHALRTTAGCPAFVVHNDYAFAQQGARQVDKQLASEPERAVASRLPCCVVNCWMPLETIERDPLAVCRWRNGRTPSEMMDPVERARETSGTITHRCALVRPSSSSSSTASLSAQRRQVPCLARRPATRRSEQRSRFTVRSCCRGRWRRAHRASQWSFGSSSSTTAITRCRMRSDSHRWRKQRIHNNDSSSQAGPLRQGPGHCISVRMNAAGWNLEAWYVWIAVELPTRHLFLVCA